jgi:hypothetical protein
VLVLHVTTLNKVIEYNGGNPSKRFEDLVCPIFKNDFKHIFDDLISKSKDAKKFKEGLWEVLKSDKLPEGWKFSGKYQKNPQIHLIYKSKIVKEEQNLPDSIGVFLCSCSTQSETLSNRRGLYILDLPLLREGFDDDNKGAYSVKPFTNEAAWLSLVFYGKKALKYSVKSSYELEATIKVEGEVKYKDLGES